MAFDWKFNGMLQALLNAPSNRTWAFVYRQQFPGVPIQASRAARPNFLSRRLFESDRRKQAKKHFTRQYRKEGRDEDKRPAGNLRQNLVNNLFKNTCAFDQGML